MKTLISDTEQEVVYRFEHGSNSRLSNYLKDETADPQPDYGQISDEDYERWLVWLGVSE